MAAPSDRRVPHARPAGGAQFIPCGTPILGEPDPSAACLTRPNFVFTQPNLGKVRQSAAMLGYLGELPGVGRINQGFQRASFRARFQSNGQLTETREQHWLYNASLGINLTKNLILFGGTQRGLEDSGAAPDTAANRAEQLPAALSTQYEAGLHWNFGTSKGFGGQLVLSAFQISKPYFTFDDFNRYSRLGTVRHKGIEVSLSSHMLDNRLSLLAGAVFMKPKVLFGPGQQGTLGTKPVGARPVQLRLDANYRSGLWGGFTPTVSFSYFSTAASSARTQPALGGSQVILAGRTSLDIGARQPIHIGRYPASIRFRIDNVLDVAAWYVVASNTYSPTDRRRFSLSLLVDIN